MTAAHARGPEQRRHERPLEGRRGAAVRDVPPRGLECGAGVRVGHLDAVQGAAGPGQPEEDCLAGRLGEDLPSVEAVEPADDARDELRGPRGAQAAAGDVHGVRAEVAAEEGPRREGEEHVVQQGG